MRPWLIASGDFTTTGGMDRANYGLASYLARTGRPVHLVAHRVASDLANQRGISIHPVPRPFGAHLIGAPLLSRAARRVSRSLGRSACRLANGGNTALAGAIWIHYLHAAFAPSANGSLRTSVAARVGRRYHLRRERHAIERADVIICNSARTAADVSAYYGVPESRLRVIYYGVDAGEFTRTASAERSAAREALGIAAGRYAAVFAGALGDRRKGFDVLFDAWQVLQRDPAWDVDLLVVGAGGERTSWMERARRAGLDASIRFFGFREDIAAVFAAADVVVHPARYEAYGLAVHEAICRGVPALVSAAAGVAERYPRELGGLLLPDPLSSRALVTSLRAWRARAADWRTRVDIFAARLASRSWDQMAAEITAAIES